MRILQCSFALLAFVVTLTAAWDTEELEIFDLVEEINENFYTVLGVQQVRTYILLKI